MSNGVNFLHSHSGIERELHFPKDIVLVDEKYEDLFIKDLCKPFPYKRKKYIKVPISEFVRKGGLFKNMYE